MALVFAGCVRWHFHDGIPMRLTEEQYADLMRRHPRPINPRAKFKNIRTEKDGQKFDSKWEAERFQQLKLMESAGEIRDLRAQVSFDLVVNGQLVCRYIADFVYVRNGRRVVEDSKSKPTVTRLYKLKAKLMKAIHGIEIVEVYR